MEQIVENAAQRMRLSDSEELANAITHGLGCAVALAATLYVLATIEFATSAGRIGFAVYALSLMLVLFMSTISHSVRDARRLHQFRAWDQGAIYLLIAGTYTPGILAFSDSGFARSLLVFVWGVGLFGFYSKVIAQKQIHATTTVTYLLLGWVPALCLFGFVPRIYFLWLLAGGLCYSAGVIFLLNDRRVRYFHAVWHIWVTLGAGVHYYAICTMAI